MDFREFMDFSDRKVAIEWAFAELEGVGDAEIIDYGTAYGVDLEKHPAMEFYLDEPSPPCYIPMPYKVLETLQPKDVGRYQKYVDRYHNALLPRPAA